MASKAFITSFSKVVAVALGIAAASVSAPALAWGLGPHPDGWYQVTVDGQTFWMPPHVCTVGHITAHRVVYLPQTTMDRRFHAPAGRHVYGELIGDDYGWTIFISSSVSPRVQALNLVHEEAELRGCGDDPVDRLHTIGG